MRKHDDSTHLFVQKSEFSRIAGRKEANDVTKKLICPDSQIVRIPDLKRKRGCEIRALNHHHQELLPPRDVNEKARRHNHRFDGIRAKRKRCGTSLCFIRVVRGAVHSG